MSAFKVQVLFSESGDVYLASALVPVDLAHGDDAAFGPHLASAPGTMR